MADASDNKFYVEHRKEERYLEYKSSMIWSNEDTKIKVAQAMMAMSNLREGGVIVVGMKETSRGVWQPDSMTEEQMSSFNQDGIAQWVNEYANPAVQFTVEPFRLGENNFVIISIRGFRDLPTICRRHKIKNGQQVLKEGAIYYRSNSKNESAPISSEQDMRELITTGVNQGIAREIENLRRLGLVAGYPQQTTTGEDKYRQEREGL